MNRCLLSLVVFCLFCTACGEDDTGQESMNEVIRINPMMNDRSDFGVDNAGNEAGTMVEAGGDVVGGSVAGTTVVDAGSEAGKDVLEGGTEAGIIVIEAGTTVVEGGTEGGTDMVDAGSEAGTTGIEGGTDMVDAGTEVVGQSMCDRLRSVVDQVVLPTWTGSANECLAGEMGVEAQESVLRMTNFYRSLADLNPVVLAGGGQEALQACALMMEANGRLSHSPPESWACYSTEGAQKAGRSNLAGANAVDALLMYMIDRGNHTTMGHRRWIMSKGLQTIGVGSTSGYSCMEVLHLNRQAGWVAYPPPGEFPVQLLSDRWSSIDDTGWTIQMNGISGQDPVVEVSANGMSLPVEVNSLLPNYGSEKAFSLIPQGWVSEAGVSYTVRMSGLSEEIEYTVDMVDCGF